MESNVLSWNVALDRGYKPELYPYATESVPLGEYRAVLDFKIWAKKAMAVSCYFTQKDSNVRFQLAVYRRQIDKEYKLDNDNIDFKVSPIDAIYLISVALNNKQKAAFKNAAIIESEYY